MFSIIVAIGENNEIGKDNLMPWHLPDDLKYFKSITKNHKIIMGKNTFYSIPKVLPDRESIILTRDSSLKIDNPDVSICQNIDSLIEQYELSDEEVFIGGGTQIYTQFLPYCRKLYLTRVNKTFIADTTFPAIDYDKYTLESTSDIQVDLKSNISFKWEVYKKVQAK